MREKTADRAIRVRRGTESIRDHLRRRPAVSSCCFALIVRNRWNNQVRKKLCPENTVISSHQSLYGQYPYRGPGTQTHGTTISPTRLRQAV